MRNIYKRAIWTAFMLAVLISSYLVLKSVIARTREIQNPSPTRTEEGNSPRAIRQIALVSGVYGTQNINPKDMYTQMLSHIKAARESRDINELRKIGDEIELTWYKLDASSYASLMLEVCNALSSTNLNNDNQYSLEQKYASIVLNKQLQIPADIEAQLVLHLQEDIEYAKGQISAEEWQGRRRNKAELWLRTWQHLNTAIDPSFDFKDLPLENVPPPPGAAGAAGMSPDRIKDPALRAQYQSAIDANTKKAEEFRTQYVLYKTRELFHDRMKAYLIRSYSRPPENIKEIEAMLKKYLVDEKTRVSILSAIKIETSDSDPK